MPFEGTDAREEQIGRLINEYLDRRAEGESVSEQSFLEQHPDLAGDLRDHLALLSEIGPPRTAEVKPRPRPEFAVADYELVEEIGRGRRGVVYQARQPGTEQVVAIRIMNEEPFTSEVGRLRFERELELAGRLTHPHLVAIHQHGVDRGHRYFVMDYVEGESLSRYVKNHRLSIRARLRLMQQICQAVQYAHRRGLVHRHLKPSNILIDGDGKPHLLDFGLAWAAEPEQTQSPPISATGRFVGTLRYMAPEQARGAHQDIDTRTDIYALGVIAYRLLTGTYPYPVTGRAADVLSNIVQSKPRDPSTINHQIDDRIETILLRALAKERARRYPSAVAMAREIRRYLAAKAIEDRQQGEL